MNCPTINILLFKTHPQIRRYDHLFAEPDLILRAIPSMAISSSLFLFSHLQEDMRLVISQQVQHQVQEREKEQEKEKMASSLQRNIRTSRSFRLPGEERKKRFFSSLFGGE